MTDLECGMAARLVTSDFEISTHSVFIYQGREESLVLSRVLSRNHLVSTRSIFRQIAELTMRQAARTKRTKTHHC